MCQSPCSGGTEEAEVKCPWNPCGPHVLQRLTQVFEDTRKRRINEKLGLHRTVRDL